MQEGGWRLCKDREDNVVFFNPRGVPVFDAADPVAATTDAAEPADAVERLVAGNRARGVEPDADRVATRYRHDRDVPWSLEAAAMEALDP